MAAFGIVRHFEEGCRPSLWPLPRDHVAVRIAASCSGSRVASLLGRGPRSCLHRYTSAPTGGAGPSIAASYQLRLWPKRVSSISATSRTVLGSVCRARSKMIPRCNQSGQCTSRPRSTYRHVDHTIGCLYCSQKVRFSKNTQASVVLYPCLPGAMLGRGIDPVTSRNRRFTSSRNDWSFVSSFDTRKFRIM